MSNNCVGYCSCRARKLFLFSDLKSLLNTAISVISKGKNASHKFSNAR